MKVTDPVVLSALSQQGFDKDCVEFTQDYGKRGKGQSPYAKSYQDMKSNKRFLVVSNLPMVDAYGQSHELKWIQKNGTIGCGNNIFHCTVDNLDTRLIVLSDQPDKKKNDEVLYHPQLFISNVEVKPISALPKLLEADPRNSNYSNNVLEWDYGVCKRRLRLIEGRILGSWVFTSRPLGDVRIKYNQTGKFSLKLGKFRANNDEELIPLSAFSNTNYPLYISDSSTFYPDEQTETTSCDGAASQSYNYGSGESWATIIAAAGNGGTSALSPGVIITSDNVSGKWGELRRGIVLFDTSALTGDATVSAAVFSLYGEDKYDYISIAPDINVYSSAPASNTIIVAGDYDSLGATAFCDTPISYASWSTEGYNDFTLNSTGIAAVSTTSITKLGVRNASYDVAEISPEWASYNNTAVLGYDTEQGAGYKPKLVVTYTAPQNYERTLTTAMGMSASISRNTTYGRSLTTAMGMSASLEKSSNSGTWLVVASQDSGSIKTRDGTTWTVCAHDDEDNTLQAAYLTQFENHLCALAYQNTGFRFSTNTDNYPSIVEAWTDKPKFPNLPSVFTAMFSGRDASGNPALYFLTPQGMYYLDVFTNFVSGPTEVTWETDDTSGKKGLYWKGDNYVAVGKGIYKVSNGEASPIGPDMDDGLPENLQGTITDMIGAGFWMVIALDGGAGKKSCILKRYITGTHWHPVYIGSLNTPIRALMWDSGTLYFGEGTNVKSLPFPNITENVTQISGHTYAASGDIIYPKFHSEFESMTKVAHKVRAVTRDCNENETITIYYRKDEDTAWTELGSFTTSPRPTALSFPSSGDEVGVSFENIQLKASLARGSTTTNSPKLESLILEYRVIPPILWGFSFNVMATSQGDRSGQDIVDALRTALETGTLMSFYPTGNKDDTEYFVEMAGMPGGEKGTEFGQEGIYQVTVQEVID
jgi:hypothetical protein